MGNKYNGWPFLVALITLIVISSITISETKTAFNNGLEECLIDEGIFGSDKVIRVKDCNKYRSWNGDNKESREED